MRVRRLATRTSARVKGERPTAPMHHPSPRLPSVGEVRHVVRSSCVTPRPPATGGVDMPLRARRLRRLLRTRPRRHPRRDGGGAHAVALHGVRARRRRPPRGDVASVHPAHGSQPRRRDALGEPRDPSYGGRAGDGHARPRRVPRPLGRPRRRPRHPAGDEPVRLRARALVVSRRRGRRVRGRRALDRRVLAHEARPPVVVAAHMLVPHGERPHPQRRVSDERAVEDHGLLGLAVPRQGDDLVTGAFEMAVHARLQFIHGVSVMSAPRPSPLPMDGPGFWYPGLSLVWLFRHALLTSQSNSNRFGSRHPIALARRMSLTA
ncbi:hypothetical protein MIPYR_50115 [uncultured Microbacterium sp.]|uniref:Uncharacterized protein n=1 Tax=uncultured Microbacterium sp. TaxID=191216 RepID=A0A1Y5P5Q6_9MICO|nr:hypothetical protein MIPYR_50115 [uncultured Microbacterium sp.]